MKLRTAADLLRSGQAGALLSLSRLTPSYYRVCFLGTAAATGLLRRLAPGPASLDQLTGALQLLERVSPPSPLVGESERLAAELRMRTDGAGDQATLRARIAADPDDLRARLDLGRTLAALGKHEDALAELLDVVRRDPHFADDGARRAMVDLFAVLGSDDPLTDRYRNELAKALFR